MSSKDNGPYPSSFTTLRWLRESAATTIGAILAIGLVLTISLTDFDFIKLNLPILSRIQKHQVDDVRGAIALTFVGLAIDRSNGKNRRQAETAEQPLAVSAFDLVILFTSLTPRRAFAQRKVRKSSPKERHVTAKQ
jgi:hypothetical protein